MTDSSKISEKEMAIMITGIGSAAATGSVIGSVVPGAGTLIQVGLGGFSRQVDG